MSVERQKERMKKDEKEREHWESKFSRRSGEKCGPPLKVSLGELFLWNMH
jgi:hypothetical protein